MLHCLGNSKCFVCGDWFIPKNGRKKNITIVSNTLFSAIYTILKRKTEQKPQNPHEPTTFSLSSVFLFQLSDLLCWSNLHLTQDHECSAFDDCPLTSNNLPDHWKCQAGGPPVLSYREWWHGIILNKCCLFLNKVDCKHVFIHSLKQYKDTFFIKNYYVA